jgi:hypothetical protein
MNFDHALVEVILGLRDLAWNRGACAALTNIEFLYRSGIWTFNTESRSVYESTWMDGPRRDVGWTVFHIRTLLLALFTVLPLVLTKGRIHCLI